MRSHSEPTVSVKHASDVQFGGGGGRKKKEREEKDPGSERGRLDKQDGAAADWQAAGGRGADCDPKDVARMVEDYVIEKKEDASSQQKPRVYWQRTFNGIPNN